jgi:hypothetical protein
VAKSDGIHRPSQAARRLAHATGPAGVGVDWRDSTVGYNSPSDFWPKQPSCITAGERLLELLMHVILTTLCYRTPRLRRLWRRLGSGIRLCV